MNNAEYKAAGTRAGRLDAHSSVPKCADRAWFNYAIESMDSPGGRHIFEAAYELAYAAARAEQASARNGTSWLAQLRALAVGVQSLRFNASVE